MSLTCEYTSTGGASGSVTATTYAALRENLITACGGYISYLASAVLSGSGDNDASDLFKGAKNCTTINLTNWDSSNVTSLSYFFNGCYDLTSITGLNNINTKNCVDFSYMFYFCTSLTSIDISNLDISNGTDFRSAFRNLDLLTSIYLPKTTFKCSSSTEIDFTYAFKDLPTITYIDLSPISVTGKTVKLNYMFQDCTSLKILDIWNWNPYSVYTAQYFVEGCTNLTTIYCNYNMGSKGSSTSTKTRYAFRDCTSLVGAISYDSSKIDINYANYITGYFTNVGDDVYQISKSGIIHKIKDEKAIHSFPAATSSSLGGVKLNLSDSILYIATE